MTDSNSIASVFPLPSTDWKTQNADPRMGRINNDTSGRCMCRGCGNFFNSVKWFDIHRIWAGKTRICRSPEWMTEKGWALTGLGFWLGPTKPPTFKPYIKQGDRPSNEQENK